MKTPRFQTKAYKRSSKEHQQLVKDQKSGKALNTYKQLEAELSGILKSLRKEAWKKGENLDGSRYLPYTARRARGRIREEPYSRKGYEHAIQKIYTRCLGE